jgi:hypothetical protein
MTTAPLILGWRRLEGAHRGVAGDPEHIALAPLSQLLTKPRVAAQFIVAGYPAVGDLISPLVEHLQALLLARLIPYLRWHMTFLASPHVPCPVLRQIQPEVEQGMVVVTDIAHEHTDLAVVDFSSVAAPLPFDTYRMRATFKETTGIEGNDAIRLTQSIGHLTHQHLDQRAMRPWGGANKFLQDLSLDID